MAVTRAPGLSLDYAIERAEKIFQLSDALAPVPSEVALSDIQQLSAETLILLKSIRHVIYGAKS